MSLLVRRIMEHFGTGENAGEDEAVLAMGLQLVQLGGRHPGAGLGGKGVTAHVV